MSAHTVLLFPRDSFLTLSLSLSHTHTHSQVLVVESVPLAYVRKSAAPGKVGMDQDPTEAVLKYTKVSYTMLDEFLDHPIPEQVSG